MEVNLNGANGHTPTAVDRYLGCHFSTVARLSQRHQITGSVNDRPRTGRPRVTTAAQDRYIRVTHLKDRMMPATHTVHQVHGPRGPVSTDTVRCRLRAARLRNRRPSVGPILTPRRSVSSGKTFCLQMRAVTTFPMLSMATST